MKTNTDLLPDLVDNGAEFTGDFFERFPQRPAPEPLELCEGLEKTYDFPTFYADVTCAMAVFLCSFPRAAALLPHPSMRPVRMTRGRAVVLLSCYEYTRVSGLAPYNEIAMTIPIMVGGSAPPVAPLLMDFEKQGYYVFSMPVTSLENQIRGTRIWGLPKIVEEIEVTTTDSECTTVAYDEGGERYFELTVPTTGSPKQVNETGYLYSVLDGRLLKSRACFEGNFALTTNLSRLWRKGGAADRPSLVLGSSHRADALRSLEIEEKPFQFRYCPSMKSCFDLPLERREM